MFKKDEIIYHWFIHFEYEFRPSNAFKNGIYDAWFNDCTQLPREFADMYGLLMNGCLFLQ